MAMRKAALGTVLAIAVAGMVATALGATFIATHRISNMGNLRAIEVGVYWDVSCTNIISSIDWGVLAPGSNKQFTIYVKNEGSVPLKLSMTVNNWNPQSASNYITLNWNREGQVLNGGTIVQATLTLLVSSSISGVTSFSFDIIIAGTEPT